MITCPAIKCIRQTHNPDDIAGFAIERNCPKKETECPFRPKVVKNPYKDSPPKGNFVFSSLTP
jgi:hypothetical protein